MSAPFLQSQSEVANPHLLFTVKTVWNNTLEITPGEDGAPALINGTAVSTPDILAMNGAFRTCLHH